MLNAYLKQDEKLYVSAAAPPESPAAAAGVIRGDLLVSMISGDRVTAFETVSANDAALAINAAIRAGPVQLQLQRSPVQAVEREFGTQQEWSEIEVVMQASARSEQAGGWNPFGRQLASSDAVQVRKTVSSEIVEHASLNGGIRRAEVVAIKEFSASTAEEVKEAIGLCDVEAGGRPCELMVLDLRGPSAHCCHSLDPSLITWICCLLSLCLSLIHSQSHSLSFSGHILTHTHASTHAHA